MVIVLQLSSDELASVAAMVSSSYIIWEEQSISYEKKPTLIKQYIGQVGNTFTGVAVDITPLSNSMTIEQLTEDFFKKRFDRKSSPFSPKFQYYKNLE